MSHFLISAAHKSSGKTTVSIGLCAALKSRNLAVGVFKKGPDYIDPLWLAKAAARPCYNLDFYTMQENEIVQKFYEHSIDMDVSIIEGNKGLYDGLDLHGSNSNAALAKLLNAPVILVLDARGMTRGVAPLVLGYQAFDKQINIAGVILNRLGGRRHEQKLRNVIEHYTDVPVLGAILNSREMEIAERHLGLVPSNETTFAEKKIESVTIHIEDQVDINKVIEVASKSELPPTPKPSLPLQIVDSCKLKIGIIQDSAFGFYYPDDLQVFEQMGIELLEINSLHDTILPNVDGLFIGGGFPETNAQQLQDNNLLRKDIYNAIESGLPVYAECGGLMYLSKRIIWGEKSWDMVGSLPVEILFHDKPQGRGYVTLQLTEKYPWPRLADEMDITQFSAHEFHYSSIRKTEETLDFAYEVTRGTGIDGSHDGIVYKNVLACYAHLHSVSSNRWVRRFVQFVKSKRK